MKYIQQPKSVEQLQQMLLDKGMLYEDEPSFKRQLSQIGYFRLKNYMRPFEVVDKHGNHTYQNDTYFETIIDNYKFDCYLRVILFEAISYIEIAIKSLMNYSMTKAGGAHWYLDPDSYLDQFNTILDENYKSRYDIFLKKLSDDCNKNPEQIVRKYREVYTDPELPPSWMIMEIISFGTACELFKNIKSKTAKSEIALPFKINYKFLDTWLDCLNHLRNKCAHNQNLIGRHFKYSPHIPLKTSNRFLEEYKIIDTKGLYAGLCIIQNILLKLEIECQFKETIIDLINVNPQINLTKLGFTPNWKDEVIWK
jgi:abortive infection bacteriophage resistance protein